MRGSKRFALKLQKTIGLVRCDQGEELTIVGGVLRRCLVGALGFFDLFDAVVSGSRTCDDC